MTAPRALIVSIHDVAPSTQLRVERMLAELAQEGVTTCPLLVVPDYHHSGSSLGVPEFVQWLKDAQKHEIVLHGFYHTRARQPGESLFRKLVTRIYTADEGEFFDLSYEEATRRLRSAREEFGGRGFHPSGFIAPAWLLGPEAERAVRDAGFRYTTTLGSVYDLVSARKFDSQSLVYSVRSNWRRAMSLFWNQSLFRRLTTNPLLRISLHPPDRDYPKVWDQIRSLIAIALKDRRLMIYDEWLNLQTIDEREPIPVP